MFSAYLVVDTGYQAIKGKGKDDHGHGHGGHDDHGHEDHHHGSDHQERSSGLKQSDLVEQKKTLSTSAMNFRTPFWWNLRDQ